ncbi:MAG: hypothetical protein A3F90_09395 [Deltaproteobacteria bacterium RIFCSPLOWO2_12_FULL_60_19]|nr:MAG: hypothetical protein A3F90_09395 [Deltaproteobacteria bacterium RIFCSPLOWO2_12_FULL_60_19]
MNAKKEHELFAKALEAHLAAEVRVVERYKAFLDKVDDTGPVRLLLSCIVVEAEQHHALLCAMMQLLKKQEGNGVDELRIARNEVAFWTPRLRQYEQRIAADCLYLKSQACWEGAELFDAVLEGMIMDSRKHEKLLLAIEKMAAR